MSDRLSRKLLLMMGWLLVVVVYGGLAVAQSPGQVWLLVALYGLHMGMTQGVLLAIVADRVPETMRGTAFGFLNLLIGVALLPASVLAGWLWQAVSPSATFGAGGLFAIAAIGLLGMQRDQTSQR